MIRHRSLVMIFSDLLADPEPILRSLHRLRFSGHDVIIFHVLDEAEALFPFDGMLKLKDNETKEVLEVDADAIKADYLDEVENFATVSRPTAFALAWTTSPCTRECPSTKHSCRICSADSPRRG